MKKLIFFAALVLFSCSGTDQLTGPGGSSETQNGFIYTALQPDGTPAVDAVVRVRPADYLAGSKSDTSGNELTVIDTVTDDHGQVTIERLRVGEYCVEINDEQSTAGMIRFTTGKQLQTNTVTLEPYGSVTGKLERANQHYKYVKIMGLERIDTIDSDGFYTFHNVPEGTYTIQIVAADDQSQPLLVDSIDVTSDQASVVGYRLKKTVVLNTTASGADIAEDQHSFPVVVRLDSSMLPIPADTGICFTKTDGTELPFQVEHWNSALGSAVVWVNVDTVRGNDSTLVYLHYGSEMSPALPATQAVFDSEQFAGVWHLGEGAGLNDATPRGRNGTGYFSESGKSTEGVIGNCQEFNGLDEYILIPGLLDSSKTLTLSAWISSVDSVGEIITVGNNAGFRFFSDSNGFDIYSYFSFGDETTWRPIGSRIEPHSQQWNHVALVIDSSADLMQLYINSVLESEAFLPENLVYNKAGSDTFIGRAIYGENHLEGLLDEVRICNTARSAGWLKLCFENQKRDQSLVSIR